jgi:HJR/Mrr/RecB family endonuclease
VLKTLLRGLLGDSAAEVPLPKPAPMQPARPLPTLAQADLMDDPAFEAYLASLFSCLEYQVERTQNFDQGADLVLIRDGVRTAVQVERWNVELKAVCAVIASMRPYNCTQAMVVTNTSNFTQPARTYARDNGVVLWGRKELRNALLQIGPDQ